MTKKSVKLTKAEKEKLKKLESELLRASKVITPELERVMKLSTAYEELFKPTLAFTNFTKEYTDSIKRMQEDLLKPALAFQNSLKPLLDTQDIFKGLIEHQLSVAKMFEGLVIDLSPMNVSKALIMGLKLNVDITSFKQVRHTSDYLLEGSAIETREHKRVSISASANFELRLSSIEQKIEQQDDKLNTLIDYSKDSHEVILQLSNYIKEHGSNKAVIKQVEYNKRSTTLTIEGKDIKLKSDTYESLLCYTVLARTDDLSKRWEIEDIVEAMGEYPDSKDWNRVIYDKIRELNKKIYAETGIQNFFTPSMKFVEVNPAIIS